MWKSALILTIACSASALADEWVSPRTIDEFGTRLSSESVIRNFVHRRRDMAPAAKHEERRSVVQDVAVEKKPKPKFNTMMLIAYKGADRYSKGTFAACEKEMDDCFKDRLGRGFALDRANSVCSAKEVCLLPIELNYSEFTIVSRMLKAKAVSYY